MNGDESEGMDNANKKAFGLRLNPATANCRGTRFRGIGDRRSPKASAHGTRCE